MISCLRIFTGALICLWLVLLFFHWPVARADLFGSHNIDTESKDYHWAWNDVVGWIDFHANRSVEVKAAELRGWASSGAGAVVLNCATTPAGDLCSSANGNFKVKNSRGDLSGWAWSDALGWISFDCADLGICSTTGNYRVRLQPAGDGKNTFFEGWAWSEIAGWISFSCENDHDPVQSGVQSLCTTMPTYRVQTNVGAAPLSGVLESNVLDTGISKPAYNYILWQGRLGTGAGVYLQLATADAAGGPWEYSSPAAAIPAERVTILADQQGKRYFKYRLWLLSDSWQQATPVVEDVIVNFSP